MCAFHTEGAGGGHAPDITARGGWGQRLPSSTNPTMPLHHQHAGRACGHAHGVPPPGPSIAEDLAFAESRIRRETIAAEDILHDLGAISMILATARPWAAWARVILRTWQTAHKMKVQRGEPGRHRRNDNAHQALHAKYTINPAIAHGIAHEVGSLGGRQVGRYRDLVPAFLRRQTRSS